MSNIPQELLDPISLDIMKYPISLPCCGRIISRDSIANSLKTSSDCPLCKSSLVNFNPNNVAKCINIAYQIEEYHKNNPQVVAASGNINNNTNNWNATIEYIVTGNTKYQTVIGELSVTNPAFKNFMTLLLIVVDKSGSMSGSPIKQCQYSIKKIVDLTFRNTNLITVIIPYDDRASSILVDKINGVQYYDQVINTLPISMGGTSFRAAFDEIVKVCKTHTINDTISNMITVFLTDGQDSIGKTEFANPLKTQIQSVWTKPFVIHCIGFGQGHDFEFLNKLRRVGTSEGAYKFADPSEDNDSLSNKINSIMDVITESSVIPVQIKETNNSLPIISGENGKYWVNLTKYVLNKSYDYVVSVNGKEPQTVTVSEIKPYDGNGNGNEGDNNKMQSKWYSYLIDEIASELILLSNNNADQNKQIDKQIHLELLQQRSRSILLKITEQPDNYERLNKLLETLNTIKQGEKVNQMKLNDIKSEGKFKTATSGDGIKQGTAYQSLLYGAPTTAYVPPVKAKPKNPWSIIKMDKRHCTAGFFELMGNRKTEQVMNWIEQFKDTNTITDQKDEYGSNVLMFACSMKRGNVVDKLLSLNKFDVNAKNNKGFTALDLALIYGVWYNVDKLLSNGATVCQDGNMLLRTCISKGYFNSASRIVKNKIAFITEDMLNDCPTIKGVEWLSINSSVEINIETAILKGMSEHVLNSVLVEKMSIKPFLEIFAKSTHDHIKIFDHLLKLNLIDIFESVEIVDETDSSTEIVWSLFIACKRGNLDMVNFIIKYVQNTNKPALLDKQNNKGVTALWISCSTGKNIEIPAALLTAGANPNIPNFKGDSCLIPACQKEENLMLVEMLLDSGASLDVYNRTRENAVLICCRTGQAKILDLLLNSLKNKSNKSNNSNNSEELQKMLETSADIDQFWPLIAATELDKHECIKVCLKYNTNPLYIERRTPENNSILAGATCVHLACQYNRLTSLILLDQSGANMKALTSVGGYTCLHIAIKSGHRDIISYLLGTDLGREMLHVTDDAGRTPHYYATTNGNEHIYEEFFTNKLGLLLEKSLYVGGELEQKCVDTLVKYGKTLSCYDYDNITEMNLGKGETILTRALLNNNLTLVNALTSQLGADLNKMDDFGISPKFWLNILGASNVTAEFIDEQTLKMITRVNLVAKSSIQNKMLTNISAGSNTALIANFTGKNQSDLNQLMKMNDGFSLKVKNDVLTTLKTFKSATHSLLTFLDKVKNSNKDIIDYTLFQGKVQLIKIIASSDNLVLEPNHIMALYLYTSSPLFYCVNKTLMNWSDKQNDIYKPFIGSLYQGINLLQPYVGEVYRAVDTQFDPELYAINNVISWNAFSVCSKARGSCNDIINSNKGIVFVIQSTTGRDVSKYTDNPANEDIIFLPESKFKITNHHVSSMICIAQANIRNTTYVINDKNKESYYNKVLSGKACIVVVLEEVEQSNTSYSSSKEVHVVHAVHAVHAIQ